MANFKTGSSFSLITPAAETLFPHLKLYWPVGRLSKINKAQTFAAQSCCYCCNSEPSAEREASKRFLYNPVIYLP